MVSGAPLLGAIETVKATLSGSTFGLPVSEVLLFLIQLKFQCGWLHLYLFRIFRLRSSDIEIVGYFKIYILRRILDSISI